MKYLKKIANRARTGIFKPFRWGGHEYQIKSVSGHEYKWLLWDKRPAWMKATCIDLQELTAEELAEAIQELQSIRTIEEVHES